MSTMTIRGLGQMVIETSGGPELLAKFLALPDKAQRRVARKGLTAGMRIVRQAIQSQAPAATTRGHSGRRLKRAIGSRMKRGQAGKDPQAVVGVGVGKKRATLAPHLHLVALGTTTRYTGSHSYNTKRGRKEKRTGNPVQYRGIMPADDFVGRAYRSSGSSAVSTMIDVMRVEIEASAQQ